MARPGESLIVVYGRRRCGKSRLLQEALRGRRHVYYVADLSAAGIQRQALAAEMERVVPGFAAASYPDWTALLETWCARAPDGAWLVLDELPYLVQVSPALPSIMQKLIDAPRTGSPRLLLCGSSQRMMLGLVLDETAPLYGRAAEIVKVTPMPPAALREALPLDPEQGVVAYSVWGGLPRNWELAADYGSTAEAISALILDRNGVLHGEPFRLLLDDGRSIVQANSLLALIGAGCHRISEIGGRLGQPATSLTRPLSRLIELGYVRRELPFGESTRSTKRTAYRLDDPFLLFWYRFVAPNRSRLEADLIAPVYADVRTRLAGHVAEVWEGLARDSVARMTLHGMDWNPAARWWGRGSDGVPLELDVVAESSDRRHLLVGAVKWTDRFRPASVLADLKRKALQLPFRGGGGYTSRYGKTQRRHRGRWSTHHRAGHRAGPNGRRESARSLSWPWRTTWTRDLLERLPVRAVARGLQFAHAEGATFRPV